MHVFLFCIAVFLITYAVPTVDGKDSGTPLAGHPYHTELWGMDIHIPPRDRRHVTAVNAGGQWIPDGPSQLEIVPFGALFIWRNWENDNQRFRGTFSGVVNNLYYQRGSHP